MKESVLLGLRVIIWIMPSKPFLLLSCNCIHDQVSPTIGFCVVFLDSLLHAANITIIDVCKSFELLICPISNHPHIGYDTATPELSPQLLLLEVVGQIFSEEALASNRYDHIFIRNRRSFPLCLLYIEISSPHRFSTLCQGFLVLLLIIEDNMRIPQTSTRILVLGQFDLGDICRIEKLAQILLTAGVRYSTHKEFEMNCLLFFFFAHQQSSYIIIIKSITIPTLSFSMGYTSPSEHSNYNSAI